VSSVAAAWVEQWDAWVVRLGDRLVGAARGGRHGVDWEVGRLMVAPDLTGRGLGRWLLAVAESGAPHDVASFVLFTGLKSARNLSIYERAGHRVTDDPAPSSAVWMRKPRSAAA
jgi:GNAT superfamily N-acetyltransferase